MPFIVPEKSALLPDQPLHIPAEVSLHFPQDLSEASRDYIRKELASRVRKAGGKALTALCFTLVPGAEEDKEAYALTLGETSDIRASSTGGLLLGFAAFLALADEGELAEGTLSNRPRMPFRAYRAFLPGREHLEWFYEMVDMLAYYQYNTLVLEVGGAMAYHRHPEINETWITKAMEFRAESGSANRLQKSFPWLKNSIHADNGDGTVLTQDEVRRLIAYCAARGLNVVPEVPTLSHCDYLLLSHPEFAEIPDDPYPDEYCPNAPGVYDLVFDVMEEILDVFKPQAVHIGHDEMYNLAICPRCRQESPVDLYVKDITIIHDWLAARGVKTIMWGEKLLPCFEGTESFGGAGVFRNRGSGWKQLSPVLYPSAIALPRDITMFHWYWRFDEALDDFFHLYGYSLVYANFNVLRMKNWNKRSPKAAGVSASNWGSYAPAYMARNGQYLSIVANAYAAAGHGFCGADERRGEETDAVLREVYRYRHRGESGSRITMLHTAETSIRYKAFYDGEFIRDEDDLLGHYVLRYANGEIAAIPVRFGQEVSNARPDWQGSALAAADRVSPYRASEQYSEVAGFAVPQIIDGEAWYRASCPDPHPESTLVSWEWKPLREDIVLRTMELAVLKNAGKALDD